MATLANKAIKDTFDSILHVEDDTAGLVATSTDSRVIQDGVGANSALALATDSVRITSTNKLYFNDVGGEYISGNGSILSIVGGSEIDLTATAIDINGTVDMDSTLNVAGNVTFNGGTFIFNNSEADKDFRIAGASETNLLFCDASTDRVGIGTDAPDSLLHLYAGNSAVTPHANANLFIEDSSGTTALQLGCAANQYNAIYFSDTDAMDGQITYNHSTGLMQLHSTTYFNFDTGSVGIGTASPGDMLHVSNNQDADTDIQISNTNSGSSARAGLIFTNDASTARINYCSSGHSHARDLQIVNNDAAGDILFYFNGGNNMVLAQDGDVGIGIAAPTAHLEVNDQAISTADPYTGIYSNHKKTAGGSASSDDYYGVRSIFTFDDVDAAHGLLVGGQFACANEDSADSNLMYGVYGIVNITGANSDVNGAHGMFSDLAISDGSLEGSVYGMSVNVDIQSGLTAFTGSAYGLNIDIDVDTDPTTEVRALAMNLYSNVDWGYYQTDGVGGTLAVRISRAGQIDAEGTINQSQSLDYAEYFESKDGKAIVVGTTVKLNGNKIVACSDGDTPIGVVRPVGSSAIVGGGQIFHWEGKNMRDDYGREIMENYTVTKWSEEITAEEYSKSGKHDNADIEGKITFYMVEGTDGASDTYFKKHKYQSDRIPEGLTAPRDAEIISPANKRQKRNPSYDPTVEYKSREDRDEWHIVGLLGQIPITKGQPVASNWIKMKDVSDSVEMYFVK